MAVYQDAVKPATISGKWHKYPNHKRKDQEIQLVTDLGPLWISGEPEKDVTINACVVHDKKTDKYFVFMTTDTGRTARQIINTYELRPEIEEDFRQTFVLYMAGGLFFLRAAALLFYGSFDHGFRFWYKTIFCSQKSAAGYNR